MNVTLSWLRKYLNTNASIGQICQKLTDIGLEVEKFEDGTTDQESRFCFATIKTIKAHPNANNLQICQVDIGSDSLVQVVCGAKNAKKGLVTVYAAIGAIIPANNLKIKKSQIRGIDSYGMLCSEAELGFSKESDGIIEIIQDIKNGENIEKLFPKDQLIDINITPNRGDCLGVFGVARDLAATDIGSLINLPKIELEEDGKSIEIISNTTKCNYIAVRNISKIQNQQSPSWLKNLLNKIGVTSHNAIIDIANYVMFSTGHPIHIYDANIISSQKIVIDELAQSQKVISLKDEELYLETGDIVAVDQDSIIALSGVIGIKNSLVTNDTTDIIIEAASFDKNQIAQTARRLKINSDAKYRFERDIDLEMIDYAIDFAASMVQEICGGVVAKKSFYGNKNKITKSIDFNIENVQKLIGIEISKSQITAILKNLSFVIESQNKDILQIKPPSFRNDIKIECDVIEEIIRIYGFNQIKVLQPQNFQYNKNIPNWQEAISQRLINNGLNETINWSFIKKQDFEIFSTINEDLKIANPISSDMEYMRSSLVPSLIKVAKNNIDRGYCNISVFEIGGVFKGSDFINKKDDICALRSGFNKEKNPYEDIRLFDVLDLKKDLLDCLEVLNIKEDSVFFSKQDIPSYFNPHKSSTVKLGNKVIAYIGEIHPLIAKKFNISQSLNIFELFVSKLPPLRAKKSKEFISNDLPVVSRDFCFVLNEDTNILEVKKEIKKSDKLITEVTIFDIYTNKKSFDGQKSITFNVMISPHQHTLALKEIEDISNKIIRNIDSKFQGKVR